MKEILVATVGGIVAGAVAFPNGSPDSWRPWVLGIVVGVTSVIYAKVREWR